MNTNRLQEGFYQAIAATDEIVRRISELSKGNTPTRRRLGTALAPPQVARRLREAAGLSEVEGLLVRGVEEGSAAERAELRRGDVLTSAGGIPLTSIDALYEVLDGEGGQIEFTVMRADEELKVVVSFD